MEQIQCFSLLPYRDCLSAIQHIQYPKFHIEIYIAFYSPLYINAITSEQQVQLGIISVKERLSYELNSTPIT